VSVAERALVGLAIAAIAACLWMVVGRRAWWRLAVWRSRRSNVTFMMRTWGFSRRRASLLHDALMAHLRQHGQYSLDRRIEECTRR